MDGEAISTTITQAVTLPLKLTVATKIYLDFNSFDQAGESIYRLECLLEQTLRNQSAHPTDSYPDIRISIRSIFFSK